MLEAAIVLELVLGKHLEAGTGGEALLDQSMLREGQGTVKRFILAMLREAGGRSRSCT